MPALLRRSFVRGLGGGLHRLFLDLVLFGAATGQKADDRQRVSIVDMDEGYSIEEGMAWFALTPAVVPLPGGIALHELTALTLAYGNRTVRFPHKSWSKLVQQDLAETAGIQGLGS